MGQLPTWLPRLVLTPGVPQYLFTAQCTLQSEYQVGVHTCTFAPHGVIELLGGAVRAGFCYTLDTEWYVNIYVHSRTQRYIASGSCSSSLIDFEIPAGADPSR